MSKKNRNQEAEILDEELIPAEKPKKKKKKKKGSGLLGRIIRRFFLLLFTVVILVVVALVLVMNVIFNGPSPAAREVLTMSLLEPSATKWIPGLFMDEETLDSIRYKKGEEMESVLTDTDMVTIDKSGVLSGSSDEWANHPDGVYIEHLSGATYNAHIMVVRDPSKVYMGRSAKVYSTNTPGKRLNEVMAEADESIIAAINAGAFNDDGTANSYVGSVPAGIVYSEGEFICNQYRGNIPVAETGGGFVGFNDDDILVVAKTMTEAEAEALNIRDGCEFGPPLIINGEVNQEAYNKASGWNPRTAIGQRDDGAVIFVCIDGRQAGSVGGTYKDVTDIMIEYGAVNACNLDGGSSSIMMYRDMHGLYGEPGQVQTINNYSVLQSQPRRMPNYWLVRTAD
ncbi:MAG: phosphodiester glycosidase family protein [Oscillospiraceae bacterium]|nr:phosphodiester glycosidase family protein [Oscillospiraceae bacterium]MBQ7129728.1 phosphodiester glycosidase family protein [Oscillospiraceae bacterium]